MIRMPLRSCLLVFASTLAVAPAAMAAPTPVGTLPCAIEMPAGWTLNDQKTRVELTAPGNAVSISVIKNTFSVADSRKQWTPMLKGVKELENTSERWWVEADNDRRSMAGMQKYVAIVGKGSTGCLLEAYLKPAAKASVDAAIHSFVAQ